MKESQKERKIFRIVENISSFLFLFLPFILVFTFALLIIETITYPGFVRKIIFFSSKEIYVFVFLISFFVIIFEKNKTNYAKFLISNVFTLNLLALPVIIFLYFLFLFEQNKNYQNFVFSKYHIHVSQVKYILIYSLLILFLSLINSNKQKITRIIKTEIKKGKDQLAINFVYILIFIFILQNSIVTTENIGENFSHIISNPFASFEQKRRWKITETNFYEFINQSTPENASIMVPPQTSPWLTEGNAGFIRYFLYPRNVIPGKLINNDYTQVDYVLIAKGSWPANNDNDYGWPKDIVPADDIIFFDMSNNNIEHLNQVYFDLNDQDNYKYRWGIIKVRK